jgi:hypothetical protein
MQERVAAESTETAAEPAAVTAAPQGPVVQRMLALQRAAGNQAVTRYLARQESTDIKWDPSLLPAAGGAPAPMRADRFVFILGAKDDDALATARDHYRSALMSSPFRKVIVREEMGDPSLAGIFDYLSAIKYPIAEITLVVHGNPEGDLFLPLNSADSDEKTTPDELAQALHDGVLKPLDAGQITDKTRIRLQACFSGHGPRMVNLLDRAFGEGEGTVIAPTVEVAYAKDIWHSEGLSGWWVGGPKSMTPEEVAVALKAKYGKSLGDLDLGTYQDDEAGHHVGQPIKDNDEMWRELGRLATEQTDTGPDGEKRYLYLTNAYTQGVKPGYEDDPVLYTKSVYYSPKEI